MEQGKRTERLVVQRGANAGKAYELREGSLRIGASPECEIVVKDQYVADVHAMIERRAEQWVISNRSVNGTLVNAVRVDSKVLVADDIVQIGAGTLLAFEVREPKKKKAKAPKEGRATGGAQGAAAWLRNPAVLVGGGAYLVAIVLFFWWLSGLRGTGDFAPIGADEANRIVARLEAELAKRFPGEGSATERTAADPADPGAAFHELRALEAGASTDARARELVATISQRVRAELFAAWELEAQGRYREAMEHYRAVQAAVPDWSVEAPRYAAQRIRLLEERVSREQRR